MCISFKLLLTPVRLKAQQNNLQIWQQKAIRDGVSEAEPLLLFRLFTSELSKLKCMHISVGCDYMLDCRVDCPWKARGHHQDALTKTLSYTRKMLMSALQYLFWKQCRSKVYIRNMLVIILVFCYKSVNYLELDFIKIYTLFNLLTCSRQNIFCKTPDFEEF